MLQTNVSSELTEVGVYKVVGLPEVYQAVVLSHESPCQLRPPARDHLARAILDDMLEAVSLRNPRRDLDVFAVGYPPVKYCADNFSAIRMAASSRLSRPPFKAHRRRPLRLQPRQTILRRVRASPGTSARLFAPRDNRATPRGRSIGAWSGRPRRTACSGPLRQA